MIKVSNILELWTCVGFNVEPDPDLAFVANADPVPASGV